MDNLNELLRAAATETPEIPLPTVPEAKQQAVAAATDGKMTALGGYPSQQTLRNAAITRQTGAGLSSSTGIERDLATLSFDAIREKYGENYGSELVSGLLAGRNTYQAQTTGSRTTENTASDAASGVGLGLANSLGGIGALSAGLANDRAGVWAANQLNQLNQLVQGTQSPALQNRRRANADRSALDYRDNSARYEQEKAAGSGIMADLRRIGRDAWDAVGNTASDPTLLADGVAQGVGSLVAAGPLGRGLSAIGRAVTPPITGTGAAARAMTALGERLPSSTSVGIGAMEAGGAFQGTASDIAGMTPAELEVNSPYYRELRAQGLSPEDARTQAANRAGLLSAGLTAPAAMAAGGLVSRFESAPLRVPNLRSAAGNLLRETAEEGIQGGTGQAAQNLATRHYADETRSLSEGVGEQIGTGALFGLGTAGVVQAPGVAGRTALEGMGAAGRAAMGVVNNRAEAVQARNAAASPVSDAKIRQAGAEAAALAPKAETTITDAIQQAQQNGATPEQTSQMEALAQRFIALNRFDPAEYQNASLPEHVRSALTGSTDRVDAIQRLADVVNQADPDSKEGFAAAVHLYRQMEKYEILTQSDPTALEAIPENHPANQIIEQFNGLGARLQQSPKIQEALATIQQKIAEKMAQRIQPVTEQSVATPEGQENLANAATLAAIAPDKANLSVNQQILLQAKQGKIDLTEAQEQALAVSIAIMGAVQRASEEQARLGHKTKLSQVSDQIQVDKGSQDDPKRSAVGFATRIYQFLRAGNVRMASSEMAEFGKFVQHMQNKVAALNQHFEQGGAKPTFKALNPESRKWYDSNALPVIHYHNPGSIELAQSVALEAQRLALIYSGLNEAMPALNGAQIADVPLNPQLMGKPQEVAQAFQKGERVRPAASGSISGSVPQPQGKSEIKVEAPKTTPKSEAKAKAAAVTETAPPAKVEPTTEAAAKPETKAEAPKPIPTPKTEAVQQKTKGTKEETKGTKEAEATTAPAAPKTVAEAFPKLFTSEKVQNWFHRAFNLPKRVKSRLLGLAKPGGAILAALSSEQKLTAFLGKPWGRSLPAKTVTAYQQYLSLVPTIIETLEKRLAEKLAKTNEKGQYAGKSPADMLREGVEANRFNQLKVLNLVEQQEDGSFRYNRPLLESAVLAGLQWMISADTYRSNMDEGLARSLLAWPADSNVSETMQKALDIGLSKVEAMRSLADKITSFWGLSENRDTPKGYTEGIPQAVAGEILNALIEGKRLEDRIIRFDESGKIMSEDDRREPFRTAHRYVPKQFKADKKQGTEASPLLAAPHLIEEAVLTEPAEKNYYGEDRPAVATHQLRNPLVRNTKDQLHMIEAAQNIAHNLNLPMLGFYEAVSVEGLQALFGAGDLADRVLNENHQKSLEGQNLSIRSAFHALTGRVSEMRTLEDGKADIEKVNIHYPFNVSSVGRLQMGGAQNPQANKLVREVILPSWSTVDLRAEDGSKEHHNLFAIAIAQHLGEKVHGLSLESIHEKVTNLLENKLAESVELLQSYLELGRLSANAVGAIKSEFAAAGVDLIPGAVHALMEHARWLNASEEERQIFRTALYIEADGVTNGPVNAMSLLTAGPFTEAWVQRMAKGGLSFDPTITTMNAYRATPEGSKDLYQTAADALQGLLDQSQQSYQDQPDLLKQLNETLALLDLLVPGVRINNEKGEIIVERIERGVTKNPLTITLYGSGANGIAEKIAQEVLDALYKRMSDAADILDKSADATFAQALFSQDDQVNSLADAEARYEQFEQAFRMLTQTSIKKERGKLSTFVTGVAPRKTYNPMSFTVSKEEMAALQANILHLFITPMQSAIESTVGESLLESAALLRDTTQVQSIVLQYAFKDRVDQALAEKAKDPAWRKSDFLSQNELDGILKDLIKTSPLVSTGSQSFFIANSQSADVGDVHFGSDLSGRFNIPGTIYGPMNAGVKGVPTLNIGLGDGMMIQNMLNAGVKGLPVFDGFNLSLTDAKAGSQKANEAVWKSWQGNPLQAVLKSYEVFLDNLPMELLESNAELRTELAKSLLPPRQRKTVTAKQLASLMQAKRAALQEAAASVDARHQVVAEHQLHVDQMAAASSPYQNKGRVLTGSPAAVAQALDDRLREIQGAASEASQEAPKPASQPDPANPVPGQPHRSGVRIMGVAALPGLLAGLRLPMNQRQVLAEILGTPAVQGYRIVTGTLAQIEDFQKDTGRQDIPAELRSGDRISGWIKPGERVIYLLNSSSETLTHELIHAATYERVLAHYEGRLAGENAPVTADAVKRLEALMDQFLNLDLEELPEDYIHASAAIRGHLSNTAGDVASNKANALNEYMAWTLANKQLAEIQKGREASPLARLVRSALDAIKSLIWGKKQAPKVGEDMFSNLLFNAAILMQSQPSVAAMNRETTLFQNRAYGDNERLSRIEQGMDQLFSRFLNPGEKVEQVTRLDSTKDPITASLDLASLAVDKGFAMTMQEHSVFERVVTALALETGLDPNALSQMDQLYRHVTKVLKVEHLMDKTAPDQQAERFYAQEKFDLLMGNFGTERDAKGRSSLLPVFMGLALVNDGFRDVLRGLPVPKTDLNPEKSLDARLENMSNRAMGALATRFSGQGKAKTVQEAIDNLTARIAETAQDRKTFIDQVTTPASAGTNAINDRVVEQIEALTDKLIHKTKVIDQKTNNKLTRAMTQAVRVAARLATEKGGAQVAEGVMAGMNRVKGFTSFREILGDIIGRTGSNASVYDMIKTVRSMVQQVRQQFREHLPSVIADSFTRRLSKTEWSTLHLAMGKTDLAALAQHFSNTEVLAMLGDPARRQDVIRTLETYLKHADPAHWKRVQAKAQQLAGFMVTGRAGTNLLRNAESVARLFNEQTPRNRPIPDQTFVDGVDQLVTLYALEALSKPAQAMVASLVQSQGKGMDFALSYLTGQRKDEVAKARNDMARFNHYKGYIPTMNQEGVSLVVVDDAQGTKLREKSYVRLGDYQGSAAERSGISRGYYFAPVSGRAAFNQGIVQNVRQTAGGVDLATGFTESTMMAGRISQPEKVKDITRQLSREGTTSENLLPVFNEVGEVVAYERSVDPVRLRSLNADAHLAKMIGVWRGRQVEEAKAQIVNEALIDSLHRMYQEDISKSSGNRNQYVDLWDTRSHGNDAVIRDALRLMPAETRRYAHALFGEQFYVRRDMLNDVLGYRNASVGDVWSGNSRWSPAVQDQVKKLVLAFGGNQAYRHLVNAEKLTQNVVKDLKTLIVIKSVVVPMANFASNIFQMLSRGVPITTIIRALPRKTAEVNAYAKSQLEKIQAEAKLRAAEGAKDVVAQRKLKAEIQAIEDGHKRLSIWPLIEAGEFSSISDAGISRDEILLTEGKLHAYMEQLVDRLPGSVRTAGRYALVTKDTALFQGLQAAVQYGDFLAKAIIYDDLTQRKKKTQAYALGRVTEEFVNYDRLPGRSRGYAEDMGLLWFYHFKLRSAKVALSMLRNNPVQALLGTLVPMPSLLPGIGTPLEDNVFSKAWDGALGFSMGPGMALRAPGLNPWLNLVH